MGMAGGLQQLGGVVLALGLLAASAQAGQRVFSPDSFLVYGGIASPGMMGGANPPRAVTDPALRHRTVDFAEPLPPGSLLVRTSERKLYFVLPGGKAIMYAVGVGREGFTWSGTDRITRKAQWPDWRPPQVMIEREMKQKGRVIPAMVPGGADNPLGARALYIGNTEYRIHGTSQPWSIGQAVSSGCIRMMNDEVIDLYDRVRIGARVVVE
jgi:lipoprotein-anchoring transpeptidase ErfK/SrfK